MTISGVALNGVAVLEHLGVQAFGAVSVLTFRDTSRDVSADVHGRNLFLDLIVHVSGGQTQPLPQMSAVRLWRKCRGRGVARGVQVRYGGITWRLFGEADVAIQLRRNGYKPTDERHRQWTGIVWRVRDRGLGPNPPRHDHRCHRDNQCHSQSDSPAVYRVVLGEEGAVAAAKQ